MSHPRPERRVHHRYWLSFKQYLFPIVDVAGDFVYTERWPWCIFALCPPLLPVRVVPTILWWTVVLLPCTTSFGLSS
jgi:hypothetical protein